MSKVISTTNAFLQTDFNGYVENFKENAIQKGWSGNSFTSFQVQVSGMNLSCQANQRIRATPMSIEFNKSVLPVVNNSNNIFFVRDLLATPPTLTPVEIPTGNVSCVGDGSVPTDQVPNSLVFAINKGLNNANLAWGVAGGIHVTVENGYTVNDQNLIGNIKFNSGGPGLTVGFVCIRDTNFPEGQSIYNRSAHNLLGLLLNEVHFDLPLTAPQINGLFPSTTVTGPTYEMCGRPPVLSPIDHVYLRSRSLLPNGLAQALNGQNISTGMIQSDIVCRIPYNEGCNYANNGYAGQNFNKIGAEYPPNVVSAYSGDLSQWQWKNQSGKDFSFFVPTNIISNIQVELTTFQGTPLSTLAPYTGASGSFLLKDNGIGAFVTLRFDVLE